MEIRNQLEETTKYINNCVSQFDWTEKFTPALARSILQNISTYDSVEKSPKGRVETLGNLSSALQNLALRIAGPKGLFERILNYFWIYRNPSEKILWSVIEKVDIVKNKQRQFIVIRWIIQIWDSYVNRTALRLLEEQFDSDQFKFKRCSFSLLKNLNSDEKMKIDSKLEGASPIAFYRTLPVDLNRLLFREGKRLSLPEKQNIQRVINQLKFGEEIAFDSLIARVLRFDRSSKIADLAYKIERKIEGLAIGESMLIPGGYMNDEGGHGVVFAVRRTSLNGYEFVVLNTGEGATRDTWSWEWFKRLFWGDQSIEPLAFQNLSKEAVIDQEFLIKLLNFTCGNCPNYDPINELYETIENHCVTRHQAKKAFYEKHPPQSWGTCALNPILVYMKSQMPPPIFGAFEREMVRNSGEELKSLLPRIREAKTFNSDTIDLVEQKAREVLSHAAAA